MKAAFAETVVYALHGGLLFKAVNQEHSYPALKGKVETGTN